VTSTIRIAHMADTHLAFSQLTKIDPLTGRNQRSVDVERAFVRTIDDILTRDVDLVVHDGDIFHHTRPSWGSVMFLIEQVRRLEAAGIPSVWIAGNHDTPRLRTSTSVYDLLRHVLREAIFVGGYDSEEFRFDDLDLLVHAIPHGAMTGDAPPLPVLSRKHRNLLMFHGMAPQMNIRGTEPGERMLAPEQLDESADYIALGHVHLHTSPMPNAWYAGSTERFGFGDVDATPGYVIVTLGPKGTPPVVEHIDIPTRPVHVVRDVRGAGLPARAVADIVLDRLRAIGDPEAMVQVNLVGLDRPTRREVERLVHQEADDLVWHLKMHVPPSVAAVTTAGEASGADLPTLDEMLTAFVAERFAAPEKQAFGEVFRVRAAAAIAAATASAAEQDAVAESAR